MNFNLKYGILLAQLIVTAVSTTPRPIPRRLRGGSNGASVTAKTTFLPRTRSTTAVPYDVYYSMYDMPDDSRNNNPEPDFEFINDAPPKSVPSNSNAVRRTELKTSTPQVEKTENEVDSKTSFVVPSDREIVLGADKEDEDLTAIFESLGGVDGRGRGAGTRDRPRTRNTAVGVTANGQNDGARVLPSTSVQSSNGGFAAILNNPDAIGQLLPGANDADSPLAPLINNVKGLISQLGQGAGAGARGQQNSPVAAAAVQEQLGLAIRRPRFYRYRSM